jgi:hypothetical protein
MFWCIYIYFLTKQRFSLVALTTALFPACQYGTPETSFNSTRSPTGSSLMTRQPGPIHLCIQVYSVSLRRNTEAPHHVVYTFVFLIEEERFLNEAVIHSPENLCKKQLSNEPLRNANNKDDCHCSYRTFTEHLYLLSTVVRPRVQFLVAHWWHYRGEIWASQAVVVHPTIWRTLLDSHDLLKVVALFGCRRVKYHHRANSSIPVIAEYHFPR